MTRGLSWLRGLAEASMEPFELCPEAEVRQRRGRGVPSSGGAKALRNKGRISQRNEGCNSKVHELELEKPRFEF